jgi:hypothetical protein
MAIAGQHRQKGLAPAQAQRDHSIVTAAGFHPDCRAVLIQIVALYDATPWLIGHAAAGEFRKKNTRRPGQTAATIHRTAANG